MSKLTRRELFGLAAGGAAVAVLPKAAEAGTMMPAEVNCALWQVEDIEIKQPPEGPQMLPLTHNGDHAMTLTWARCSNTDHYEVHRDGVLIGVTRELAYTDVGLETGRFYTYRVTAVGHSGVPSWPVGAFPPVKILPA